MHGQGRAGREETAGESSQASQEATGGTERSWSGCSEGREATKLNVSSQLCNWNVQFKSPLQPLFKYHLWTQPGKASSMIGRYFNRNCIHTYTYIHTHTHTYTYTYIHTHTHTHIYIHAYMHTHIYIHMHKYTYIHIHVHIHTHVHIHRHI